MHNKKSVCLLISAILFVLWITPAAAAEFSSPLSCKSAVLMEAATGRILYEKNPDEPLPPASVTKIMTLLLIMEAIESEKIRLTDMVPVSENAASMGGSQVYLQPGEKMTVEEMIKCVVIASANDCAVALAEFLCGSEEAFVLEMNTRAKELGMLNTNFENTNGLDDTVQNHVTSAKDIAIMSRELISHDVILKYSSIWMDSIRNGSFGLTNTNRLIRYYSGANGLKTGSTAKAKFCISATAKRANMQLIAVIMAAPSRDVRNNEAKQLLDYGFANFGIFHAEASECAPIAVKGGMQDFCKLSSPEIHLTLEKEKVAKVTERVSLPESVKAPIKKGDVLGKITYEYNGETVGEVDLCAAESVAEIGYFGLFMRIVQSFFLG